MKIIGIIGSRRRNTDRDLHAVEQAFLKEYNEGDEIVSGGCYTGGDRFAEQIARKYGVPIKIYYAKWKTVGKKAGFVRNAFIANDASILIACVAEDRTGGTEHTINLFSKTRPSGKIILV